MPFVQPQPHHGGTAPCQDIIQPAALSEMHLVFSDVLAGDRQLSYPAELLQPVAEKHHRHVGGAAFAGGSLGAVAVQAIQHHVADDFRGDFLPLKKVADGIQHGGGTAVVFC